MVTKTHPISLTIISRTQLRYLVTEPLNKEVGPTLQDKLGWKLLEKRNALGEDFYHNNTEDIFIPGGGIAKGLFQKW